ncbi:MAG TPA: diacylglycerol kinase family protein [Sphingobacteriaceae bacterium]
MKVLFVVNPKSGSKEETDFENLLAEQAGISGFEYELYQMRGRDDVRNISRLIYSYQPDVVGAAGGDGTVNLLASLLHGSGTALLIIPKGSANGMARELGIRNIPAALQLFETGVRRRIDLLRLNGRICIHLADVGPNARIVKKFERDAKRGIATYAKFFFQEMFLHKHYRFTIRCDQETIYTKAFSLTFANASRYGTGAVINPIGQIDDAVFELVIIRPFPRIKLFSIILKLFLNKLQTSEYVRVIQCKSASVSCSRRTTLQVDGEVIGKVNNIDVEMLARSLTVLVPGTT